MREGGIELIGEQQIDKYYKFLDFIFQSYNQVAMLPVFKTGDSNSY